MPRIAVSPPSIASKFSKFFPRKKWVMDRNRWWSEGARSGCMLGVVAVRFPPIPEFLSWFAQYGVSQCPAAREHYFGQLMLGISVSKFHEFVPVVENKDPHRLNAHLKQTPSESHLQNSTTYTLLWGQPIFFNNDFGKLMRTKPLFQGNRSIFHHIWQFW